MKIYLLQHRATRAVKEVRADSYHTACVAVGWLPDETALLKVVDSDGLAPARADGANLSLFLPTDVSEADFQRAVVRLARSAGWMVHHATRGRVKNGRWVTPVVGDSGAPDLLMARPPICLLVELKAQGGRLSPAQSAWLSTLQQCQHLQAHLWRPSDWEYITALLMGNAP